MRSVQHFTATFAGDNLVRAFQPYSEFVAAQSGDKIGWASVFQQQVANGAQGFIAAAMTKQVIDQFEIIKIKIDERR